MPRPHLGMEVSKIIRASAGSTEHTVDTHDAVMSGPAHRAPSSVTPWPYGPPPKPKTRKRRAPRAYAPQMVHHAPRKPAHILIKLLIP